MDNPQTVGAVVNDAAMTSHAFPDRTGRRLPVVLLTVVALAAGGVLVGRLVLDGGLRLPGTGSTSATAPLVASGEAAQDDDLLADALTALRRWDALRATAYAAGDPQRLAALYAEGAPAAAADVEVLRSYVARELVVDRMRTQVLSVHPVRLTAEEATLRVRDRLVGAEAVDEDGQRLVLPRDEPTTRVLTLIRAGDEWLMKEVRQE